VPHQQVPRAQSCLGRSETHQGASRSFNWARSAPMSRRTRSTIRKAPSWASTTLTPTTAPVAVTARYAAGLEPSTVCSGCSSWSRRCSVPWSVP